MVRTKLTVQELLAVLPAVEEVDGLRRSIVEMAAPDPEQQWARAGAYATLDRRVLSPQQLAAAVNGAEAALHHHVERLFGVLRTLLASYVEGDHAATAQHLIRSGELLEEHGQLERAAPFFEAALSLSLPLASKETQILALRRIARLALARGELERARQFYQRSAELARDSGDLRGEVIALTGQGNVLQMQGRWAEVERCYREALDKQEGAGEPDALRLERGQLFNNLGMITTRRERPDEAEQWFRRALRLWQSVDSPADLAICLHNLALLRERQGRRRRARGLYRRALRLPIPAALRAALSIDLALAYLTEGRLRAAEEWGREAERHAIASSSPYYLGRMYCGLGIIARARGEDEGFVFFEKALEIAREKGLPFLEADTLREYAGLRAQMGGVDEARAYLQRAHEIFAGLGTVDEQVRVERALREIAQPRAMPPPD